MTPARALVARSLAAAVLSCAGAAQAQRCALDGARVTCDDGRVGMFEGDAIRWPDGARSQRAPHPSLNVRNREGLHVGPGVFVGAPGGGVVPLDDPNGPNKRTCAFLNDVPYCH